MMYNTLLVAMIGLPSIVLARNARFYDTDTCGEPEGGTKSKLYDMTKDNCIYEQGRLSFMPGERLGDGGGDFCFVYYDDNHCGCIAGSRLIHTSSAAYAIDCENKEVFGRKSYHFERATKDSECPSFGCYDDDANPVKMAVKERDSQECQDYMEVDKDCQPW